METPSHIYSFETCKGRDVDMNKVGQYFLIDTHLQDVYLFNHLYNSKHAVHFCNASFNCETQLDYKLICYPKYRSD